MIMLKKFQDYSTDAASERLGFKISRIEEVSRQLLVLIDSADRGFPAHMNLALADRNKIAKPPGDGGVDNSKDEEVNRILRRLKTQNHQLTEVLFFKLLIIIMEFIVIFDPTL